MVWSSPAEVIQFFGGGSDGSVLYCNPTGSHHIEIAQLFSGRAFIEGISLWLQSVFNLSLQNLFGLRKHNDNFVDPMTRYLNNDG